MTEHPPGPATVSPPAAPRWPGLSVTAAILLVLALVATGYAIVVTIPDEVGFARLKGFVFGLLPAAALWLAALGLWLGGRAVALQRGDVPPRAVPVLVTATFVVMIVAWVLFEVVPSDPP